MKNTYINPTPCFFGREKIEELADKFAKKIGFFPNDNIYETVSNLGGKIKHHDFWDLSDTEDGSLVIEEDGTFIIHLPNHTTKARDKFVISHELGHFFLHYLIPNVQNNSKFKLKAQRYGGDTYSDYEANWFACSFLMPKNEFSKTCEKYRFDLVDIADHIGITISTVAIRAKYLELID